MTIGKERRAARETARQWLHERFPQTFMAKGATKPPLKVGIHKDVIETVREIKDRPKLADLRFAIDKHRAACERLAGKIAAREIQQAAA